ncbi:DUF1104 domain-containing protein [Sulfurovum sp.]|uniref:DUF1104 domain-containing protein n=1 Tax=Sulfurovum sp. TaxID=1969726 RepID=UPI0025EC4964|nr:DUF1104 domain-containing protein [Sulfurovum sp.]
MKHTTLIALLVTAAWSTDFSQLSTEELIQLKGTISPSERPAFRAEMQKRMQTGASQKKQQMMKGRGMGKGCGMGQGQKSMQNRPNYADFDLNHDGKITQKEFYDAQAAHMTQKANKGKMMKNAANAPTFESIDSNNDGFISETEFSAHQVKQMQTKRNQGK